MTDESHKKLPLKESPKILYPFEICGKNVLLRTPVLEDVSFIQRYLNDQETMSSLTEFFGFKEWTVEKVVERINAFKEAQLAQKGLAFVAVNTVTHAIVGSCGLKKIDFDKNQCELGIILRREYWGQGLAQEMIYLLLDHAFKDLCLDLVYFESSKDNERVRGLFSKYNLSPVRETEQEYLRFELSSKNWSFASKKLQGMD